MNEHVVLLRLILWGEVLSYMLDVHKVFTTKE